MPVPKRKRSRARRDKRFANKGMQAKAFAACNNCQVAIMPHQACQHCGFYKGKKVLTSKVDRSLTREQLRKEKQAAKGTPEQPVIEPSEKE